jgi:hypothetical protein
MAILPILLLQYYTMYKLNSIYLVFSSIPFILTFQNMNNQVIVSERAVCRVRLPNSGKSYKELDPNRKNELHLQWANSIQQLFFTDQEPPNRTYIRNWDIVLSINDGSAENYFQDQSASSARLYPPRYQLPEAISDRLDTNEERILRTELFALGSILYEVATGHRLFHEIDESVANERVIQTLIALGMFPDDLWDLPITPRILGCWCPRFISEMMAIRKKSMFTSLICLHNIFLLLYFSPFMNLRIPLVLYFLL